MSNIFDDNFLKIFVKQMIKYYKFTFKLFICQPKELKT